MRPRTVNIVVSVSGMTMPLATVTIQNFAKFLEPETELLCPACGAKPKLYSGTHLPSAWYLDASCAKIPERPVMRGPNMMRYRPTCPISESSI